MNKPFPNLDFVRLVMKDLRKTKYRFLIITAFLKVARDQLEAHGDEYKDNEAFMYLINNLRDSDWNTAEILEKMGTLDEKLLFVMENVDFVVNSSN
ncbi:MAG: hypothetical protein ACLTVB_00365 [Sutterella sp.]|jgi:hypothetical protein